MNKLAKWIGVCVKTTLVGVCCVAVATSAATPSKRSSEAGVALAEAVYNRARPGDAAARVVMSLHAKGKDPRQRILYDYGKEKGDSERWTLLRFIEPKDISGTGLLTLDYAGDDNDQWIYLPALDRVRRIASSRKGGRFVGSDFYYEDLQDREVYMDHHNVIGNGKIGGVPSIVLESVPVESSNSVYSRRLSWIHPKLYLPLQIDYFQKNSDTPVKRLRARKIKKVAGYWTIFDSTMYNLKTGHSTKLFTSDIRYDQGIPDELFSQRGLADETREKSFRP